jgi:nucleoside-diphosphate-sugar epimerase
VCGYSRRQRFDLVVNILTLNALHRGIIRVDGGDQYRPNLHIKDMVSCYVHILQSDPNLIHKQIFNVAGENLTVLEIANKVRQELLQIPSIEILPVVDPRSYRVSGSKIAKTLGFVPTFSVDDAIRDLIAAYKANKFSDVDKTEYYNIKRMQELLASGEI